MTLRTVVEFGLRTGRRHREMRDRAGNLDAATCTRGVIEQAKGILIVVHRIDENTAMQRLITDHQHRNIKVRDVAAARNEKTP